MAFKADQENGEEPDDTRKKVERVLIFYALLFGAFYAALQLAWMYRAYFS